MLNTLFPRICILCGLPSGRRAVCGGCRVDLPWIRKPCCRCGAPLPLACESTSCGICGLVSGAIDRFRTALIYEYPVDQLVTRTKFQFRTDCAAALGELLGLYLRAARLGNGLLLPDILVPVPLHRRRMVQRGFNQADEIAKSLVRLFRLPVLRKGCCRIIDTAEQTTLTGAARRKNIRGAFRVDANLAGATVAIVDDVLTTGSTAIELAQALKSAGADAVQVWAVARSLRR